MKVSQVCKAWRLAILETRTVRRRMKQLFESRSEESSRAFLTSEFDTADIITVFCYTKRLERNGVVYGWGSNASGELTDPRTFGGQTLPSEITRFGTVTDIAVGTDASYVFKDTDVYAVGYDHSGLFTERGLDTEVFDPVKVELPPIRSLVSGSPRRTSPCFAVDTSGRLLSWGENAYGELDRNYEGRQDSTPQFVENLRQYIIKQVAVGCFHVCCVTADGEVFTWGHKSYVGQGVLDSNLGVPTKLNIEKISQISCGFFQTLLLSADQKTVWAFGIYRDGKLAGFEDWTANWENSLVKSPIKVPFFGEKIIVKLQCFSFDSAVLYADGEIKVWGETWGQNPPRTINIGKVVDISMGDRFMLALTAENRVYAFGKNDRGQCGQGYISDFEDRIEPVEVKNLDNLHVKQILASNGHCLIKCAKL